MFSKEKPFVFMTVVVIVSLTVVGCGNSQGVKPGEMSSALSHGTLKLLLTDFPLDDKEVEQILVTIEKVEVQKAGQGAEEREGKEAPPEQGEGKGNGPSPEGGQEKGEGPPAERGAGKGNGLPERGAEKREASTTESRGGWITVVDEPQEFDLIQLQDDVTAPLGETSLEAGQYNQIRLQVSKENHIKFVADDALYSLKIPGGAETGVKLTGTFEIVAGQDVEITLDFNAQESVKQLGKHGTEYLLEPVIAIKNISGGSDEK